ncbi:MAG TPA: ATP-dependent zinc metalloprotease FtsH [Gemmataceae bacterium]|nr:ATP-dependent zinc metalloprotease FtsH [Gemmataceae bacterium]
MPPRQPPQPAGTPRRRPQGQQALPSGWVWLLVLGATVLTIYLVVNNEKDTIEYSDFMRLAEAHKLSSVTFNSEDSITGEVKDPADIPSTIPTTSLPWKNADELKKKLQTNKGKFTTRLPPRTDGQKLSAELLKDDPSITIVKEPERTSWITQMVLILLPALLILGIFFLFFLPRMRDPLGGSFLSNYIKSPARRYERSKMRVTFDEVADMESAKSELQEVVEFLRSPEKFQRLGAQVPKGVLLVGPPGTGKTLLARAVAGEAGVPFYSISGSEFIQMFVGVGASRVRDMFKTAKDNAPCLLFIDEIDAVGRMRGAGVGGGSDEREQTLNQILSEMDGFQPNEMVIVIAATNRPDVLDSALLRPGRFDRHVTIDRPTWQGRLAILKVHTRNKPLADDVNLESVARELIGMTGADLRNLSNEAALLATREGKTRIGQIDFERAADRILIGPKREEVLTHEDKRKTAYHEAGHALVTWLEPEADRPLKVSIIPRGQTLGVNVSVPEEERYHYGMTHFKAKLVTWMGGRAADRLIYGQPFAGAESDIKQATRLARYMVTHWGMSDRLGPMSFRVGEEHVFLGKEIQESRDFSEGMSKTIDEEVQALLREADQRAFELLEKRRPELDRLAEALLQREELSRDEIDRLLRESNIVADGAATAEVFAPSAPKL